MAINGALDGVRFRPGPCFFLWVLFFAMVLFGHVLVVVFSLSCPVFAARWPSVIFSSSVCKRDLHSAAKHVIIHFVREPLAQLVEHLTFNQGVGGSSPPWLTILCGRGGIGRRARFRF